MMPKMSEMPKKPESEPVAVWFTPNLTVYSDGSMEKTENNAEIRLAELLEQLPTKDKKIKKDIWQLLKDEAIKEIRTKGLEVGKKINMADWAQAAQEASKMFDGDEAKNPVRPDAENILKQHPEGVIVFSRRWVPGREGDSEALEVITRHGKSLIKYIDSVHEFGMPHDYLVESIKDNLAEQSEADVIFRRYITDREKQKKDERKLESPEQALSKEKEEELWEKRMEIVNKYIQATKKALRWEGQKPWEMRKDKTDW